MIRVSAHNLRSSDWRRVDARQLMDRLREDQRSGEDSVSLVPWQRTGGTYPHRTYLLLTEGGGIYLLIFRRREPALNEGA